MDAMPLVKKGHPEAKPVELLSRMFGVRTNGGDEARNKQGESAQCSARLHVFCSHGRRRCWMAVRWHFIAPI